MGRLRVFALAAIAVAVSSAGAAAAGGPVATLEQAVQRSNAASSADVTLVEHVNVGSKTGFSLRVSGFEAPHELGSFHSSSSPAQAGFGDATIVVSGTKVYVHYPIFDTLRTTNTGVKQWLLVDQRSSLNLAPKGLLSLGADEVRQLRGLVVDGHGTDDGVPVTSYRGHVALAKVAKSNEVQSLLASLPSAAARVLLKGSEQLQISIGDDGFVHHVSSRITAPIGGGTSLTITIEVALANVGHVTRGVRVPPPGQVMTLAQFQQATGSAPTANENDLLAKTVLATSQVGTGYQAAVIPGGKLVAGETTLDFCNKTYSSEALRSARLQVEYTHKGGPQLSNEVVSYQPGGARQALAEMRHAAATCKNGPVAHPPSGVRDLVRHTQLLSDPHLLPGAIAILETDSGIVKGKHRTSQTIAIFQVRGNVLSGVYGYGSSLAALKRFTLRAAEASAANLRRRVSVTPSA